MELKEIQKLYDFLCEKYNIQSVKAYFKSEGNLQGNTFRKIYLNKDMFNTRTVYHEIYHYINPSLKGGDFESGLNYFIYDELQRVK